MFQGDVCVSAATAKGLKVLKQDYKKDTADSRRGKRGKHKQKAWNEAGMILGVSSTGQTHAHIDAHLGPDAQICLAIVNQSNKEI